MAVNAGPHLDNQSECAGCGRWLDDQVLQRVGDDLFCSECVGCDNCASEAPRNADGSPKYPTCANSRVWLCSECAKEAISPL